MKPHENSHSEPRCSQQRYVHPLNYYWKHASLLDISCGSEFGLLREQMEGSTALQNNSGPSGLLVAATYFWGWM